MAELNCPFHVISVALSTDLLIPHMLLRRNGRTRTCLSNVQGSPDNPFPTLRWYYVGQARIELAIFCSQNRRSTNFPQPVDVPIVHVDNAIVKFKTFGFFLYVVVRVLRGGSSLTNAKDALGCPTCANRKLGSVTHRNIVAYLFLPRKLLPDKGCSHVPCALSHGKNLVEVPSVVNNH